MIKILVEFIQEKTLNAMDSSFRHETEPNEKGFLLQVMVFQRDFRLTLGNTSLLLCNVKSILFILRKYSSILKHNPFIY